MKIEAEIKEKLEIRGFNKSTLLNNRGLIGAVIEETVRKCIKVAYYEVADEYTIESLESLIE